MDFSFFLVIITILFYLVFLFGVIVVRQIIKKRIFRYIVFLLPAVLFFCNRIIALFFLILSLIPVLFADFNIFRKHITAFFRIVFAVLLLVFGFLFQKPGVMDLSGIDRLIENLLSLSGFFHNGSFLQIYYISYLFRPIYLSLIFMLLTVIYSFALTAYKRSYWYRYIRKFNHREVLAVVFFWLCYFVLNNIKLKWLKWEYIIIILNLAIYFSLYYLMYGFLTLIFSLKKRSIEYFSVIIIIYSLIIFSGQYFLIPLILVMGIGISDIWMYYLKKRPFR